MTMGIEKESRVGGLSVYGSGDRLVRSPGGLCRGLCFTWDGVREVKERSELK
jgi:hypothetical protein